MKTYFTLAFLLMTSGCFLKPKPVHLSSLYPELIIPAVDDVAVIKSTQAPGAERIHLSTDRFDYEISSIAVPIEKVPGLILERRKYILRLYTRNRSPYPGFVSQETSCAEKFLPKETRLGNRGVYFELYANDRHVYGVCIEDGRNLFSNIIFIYCQKPAKFYEIRVFAKPGLAKEVRRFSNALDCVP